MLLSELNSLYLRHCGNACFVFCFFCFILDQVEVMVAVGMEVEATVSSSHHTVSTSSPVSSRDLATSRITTSSRCRALPRHRTRHNNSSMAPARPTTSTTTTTKVTRRPQVTNKLVIHNNSRAMDRQPSSQHTRITRITTPVTNSSNNSSNNNTAVMALVAVIRPCDGRP